MIKYVKTSDYIKYFTCPNCSPKSKTTFRVGKEEITCRRCKKTYPIKKHILQFIDQENLDRETKRELEGNSYPLTKKNIEHYANKDKWSSYYNHFVNKKMRYLISYLDLIPLKGLVSLGSGPGFEIKEILKRKNINLIFSSDLAYSATSVVPITLKNYNVDLCLFTSDLNSVPIVPTDDLPILIYEALHHTGNIHTTIKRLLQRGYKNILFVEPSTNFVIKILAKFGLAQRIEYSGLKPDFLDIKILKRLAKKHNYRLKIHTLWDIPEDFFRKVCKKDSFMQKILLIIIDIISRIGDLFQFGSFAIVSLDKP